MADPNPDNTKLRQELNKLYQDVVVDLTKNTGSLSDYEIADREGFLTEIQSEIEGVKALDTDVAPSDQQVSNKDNIKTDLNGSDIDI